MVRRKGTHKRKGSGVVKKKGYVCKPAKGSKAKYKKCILTAIHMTKITTRKGAQKAFRAAAKKCGALLTGVRPRRKSGRRVKRHYARRGLPTSWQARSTRGVSRRRMASLPAGAEKYFG
jgi:hypothetical protein